MSHGQGQLHPAPGSAYWPGPGQVAAHTRTEEIVSTLDFLPTPADACFM